MTCELFASLGDFKSMMDLTRAVQEADVASRDKAVLVLKKGISKHKWHTLCSLCG